MGRSISPDFAPCLRVLPELGIGVGNLVWLERNVLKQNSRHSTKRRITTDLGAFAFFLFSLIINFVLQGVGTECINV